MRVAVCAALCGLVGGVTWVSTAGAQTAGSVTRTAQGAANLFATLDPGDATPGIALDLPPRWTLDDVTLLRYGTEPVDARIRPTGAPGRFHVIAQQPLRGPHEVVVRARPSGMGQFDWSIAPLRTSFAGPLVPRDSEKVRLEVTIESPSPPDDGNRAADFEQAERPFLLRTDALPSIDRRSSFTIEFWVQTTGLNQVVLSTWTGREAQPYPLEIVVDPSGRLRWYSGEPGRHRALVSQTPVASGNWHHVAVVYAADQTVQRLLLDGTPVDTLRAAPLPMPLGPLTVAVGGRPLGGRSNRASDGAMAFRGRLDELRVWDEARSTAAIRSAMHRPLPSASLASNRASSETGRVETDRPTEAFRLGFDDDPATSDALVQWARGMRVVPAGLALQPPLRDLEATTNGRTVRLRWSAASGDVRTFVVERSTDARTFDVVARLRPDEVARPDASDTPRFAYVDDSVAGHVVFYRIRQVNAAGTERVSGTLKIGLGAPASTDPVRLVGNFPNPFVDVTTIAYELDEPTDVELTVWDLAGHRIAQLANETQSPGYYERSFDASNLPSGTYFVRLETSSGTQSHRMVVLR